VKTLLILVLLSISIGAVAETRYIKDDIKVNMRSGQSSEYRIIRNLLNGDKVELLETYPETGYSRIRLPSGTEGWVSTQYLTTTPSAQDQLAAALARVTQLEEEVTSLRQGSSSLSSSHSTLEADYKKLIEDHKKLALTEQEIRQKASSTLAIDNLNQQLKAKLLEMQRRQQELEQENSTLKDSTELDWFIWGAGVLFGGVILGLVLPQIRVRKRANWDTF
jgi:SH3 domain protein